MGEYKRGWIDDLLPIELVACILVSAVMMLTFSLLFLLVLWREPLAWLMAAPLVTVAVWTLVGMVNTLKRRRR